MKKLAVLSAILEDPSGCQKDFNNVVSDYNDIVRGRLGIPFDDGGLGVVSLTVSAEEEQIREFADRLGNIKNVTVGSLYSKTDL